MGKVNKAIPYTLLNCFIHSPVNLFINCFETLGQISLYMPNSPKTDDSVSDYLDKWGHCNCTEIALTHFQRTLTLTATDRACDVFKILVKTLSVSKKRTYSLGLSPMR